MWVRIMAGQPNPPGPRTPPRNQGSIAGLINGNQWFQRNSSFSPSKKMVGNDLNWPCLCYFSNVLKLVGYLRGRKKWMNICLESPSFALKKQPPPDQNGNKTPPRAIAASLALLRRLTRGSGMKPGWPGALRGCPNTSSSPCICYPIGSMGLVYLPTIWLICMVNV